MQHTLHWGQASKSNPGLLFCPERTAAASPHHHYRGGAGGEDGEREEMEGKLGRGWRGVGRWRERLESGKSDGKERDVQKGKHV